MPQTGLSQFRNVHNGTSEDHNIDSTIQQARLSTQKPQRHSMGVAFGSADDNGVRSDQTALGVNPNTTRPISLQSSYSTSDLPTRNSVGPINTTPSKIYADQQLNQHNAHLGRIPVVTPGNRQSRDFPPGMGSTESKRDDKMQPPQSLLQASAAPFGPGAMTMVDTSLNSTMPIFSVHSPTYTYNQSYGPPGNQMPGSLAIGGPAFPVYGGFGRIQDSQNRPGTARSRPQLANDAARYDNVALEEYIGRMYDLCKDQHGCRYLQKRLEEKNPESLALILSEILPFVCDLMIGKQSSAVSSMQ